MIGYSGEQIPGPLHSRRDEGGGDIERSFEQLSGPFKSRRNVGSGDVQCFFGRVESALIRLTQVR
jgi:hypothetical protein